MAIRSNPTAGTTAGVEYSQDIEPGLLYGLSCFQIPPLVEPFSVYVIIGIKTQVDALNGRKLELARGYLRGSEGLTWTGLIPIQSGTRMYMFIRGITATATVLEAHRITPNTQILPEITLAKLFPTT